MNKPITTLPGKVKKVIPPPYPSAPEKVEVHVEGADPLYQEVRIENTLTDGDGNEVRLKPGADVEITVAAPPESTTPKSTG